MRYNRPIDKLGILLAICITVLVVVLLGFEKI